MPAYDYTCERCGHGFEVRMSMAAYAEGVKPECPACGSPKTERAFTTVNVLTAGRGGSSSGSGNSSCGHGGFS